MTQIKTLFDPQKDIYRTIEKVITYSASQAERLKAEITEYIVTDSIEAQFEKLLYKMQAAMEAGGQNEVGVWVSGFYGSGKSSFTKYLGLALDDRVMVDGVRFLRHLQDRLTTPQTRALLATLANRYPTAVVLLDLASDMVAGATMEEVSTVLYYKVLQWAGYSRNLKVAALERRLKKDGRYAEFVDRVQRDYGLAWSTAQNDALVLDSVVPELAHALYPDLFKTPTAFSTEAADIIRFETERVKEMIDIVREATGKQHILFIIDEVGQYVGARPNLILNLDGLAKNLKHIGDGQVWILGTAQQTLTEDDPKAAFNSPELYKLKDRFPIQIDLESSDIKVICTRRLLGKSPAGEQALTALFNQHGQALRQNTKLQEARYYDADFDRATFVNLYPFLPAHFDLLLHLLGALAKSTGGIGLRSAIKVIQDVLIEGPDGRTPVADQAVGWLATTVTLYDALEKDIRRAAPSIHKALGKAELRFPDSPPHLGVAKTVAVLQILGNMPVTAQNVAALMHPAVDAASRRELVDAAIQDLINDGLVPFGEKDGNLCFFSEKINDIEQERAQLHVRSLETRRLHNEALLAAFTPLPSVRLAGSFAVTTGLKSQAGGNLASLEREREVIQTIVEFVAPADYDATRARLVDESRERAARHTVYLLGRAGPETQAKLAEIYRCEEIARLHRSDPDQEVKEYCAGQTDRARKLSDELQHLLKRQLGQGSFIFRGEVTAADTLDQEVLEAARQHLQTVAEQVFDRYGEAAQRAETALAEKFLRVGNLRAVTAAVDPLALVQVGGSTARIRTDHKALLSLRDYLDRNGTVDGKRLTDWFTDAPFGWSPDTLRYLVAALLWAGEIELKISGRKVTTPGQQALDALKTNNAFKAVGVALRGDPDRPTKEELGRAAEKMRDLTGDDVVPLDDDVIKAALKHFPQFQAKHGPLPGRLEALGLAGADTVRLALQEMAESLLNDASDAPRRLGREAASLPEALAWAAQAERALNNGLEAAVRELQEHRREIAALPSSGVPGTLRTDLAEELALFEQRLRQPRFFERAADFQSALTAIKARTRDAAGQMAAAQRQVLADLQADLQRLPEWAELLQEEQAQTLAQLDELALSAGDDLRGLKDLVRQDYMLRNQQAELRRQVEALGRRRREDRLREAEDAASRKGLKRLTRTLRIPVRLTEAGQVAALRAQLQALEQEAAGADEIEITLTLEG